MFSSLFNFNSANSRGKTREAKLQKFVNVYTEELRREKEQQEEENSDEDQKMDNKKRKKKSKRSLKKRRRVKTTTNADENESILEQVKQLNDKSWAKQAFLMREKGYEILPDLHPKYKIRKIHTDTHQITGALTNHSKELQFNQLHLRVLNNSLFAMIYHKNFTGAIKVFQILVKIYLNQRYLIKFGKFWQLGIYLLKKIQEDEKVSAVVSTGDEDKKSIKFLKWLLNFSTVWTSLNRARYLKFITILLINEIVELKNYIDSNKNDDFSITKNFKKINDEISNYLIQTSLITNNNPILNYLFLLLNLIELEYHSKKDNEELIDKVQKTYMNNYNILTKNLDSNSVLNFDIKRIDQCYQNIIHNRENNETHQILRNSYNQLSASESEFDDNTIIKKEFDGFDSELSDHHKFHEAKHEYSSETDLGSDEEEELPVDPAVDLSEAFMSDDSDAIESDNEIDQYKFKNFLKFPKDENSQEADRPQSDEEDEEEEEEDERIDSDDLDTVSLNFCNKNKSIEEFYHNSSHDEEEGDDVPVRNSSFKLYNDNQLINLSKSPSAEPKDENIDDFIDGNNHNFEDLFDDNSILELNC